MISSGLFFSFLPNILCIKNEGLLYNIRPVNVKHYSVPYSSHYGLGYLNSDYPFKQKDPVYRQQPVVHGDDIFQIEASDAIDGIKYSQLDIGYQEKVPSSTFSKHQLLQTSAQNPSPPKFPEQIFPSLHSLEKNSLKLLNSMRDVRYLDSAGNEGASSGISGGEFRFENKNSENVVQTISDNAETTNIYFEKKNNFTDASENLDLVSSDALLRYEVPSEFNDSSSTNSVKKLIDIVSDVPSHNYSDFSSSTSLSPQTSNGYTTPNPIYSNTHVYMDNINITNLTDNVSSSIFPSITDEENVTNSLPSTDIEKKLSSGTVAGIVIAVLVSVTLLSSKISKRVKSFTLVMHYKTSIVHVLKINSIIQ